MDSVKNWYDNVAMKYEIRPRNIKMGLPNVIPVFVLYPQLPYLPPGGR